MHKVYKKEGKLTWKNLKKAGLDELADVAGDLHTLFDENASLWDKAEALSDLALGTEFSNKGTKEVKRIVEKVIGGVKLTKDSRRKLGNLVEFKDETVRDMIKNRGGKGSNVKEAGHWADKKLGEVANAAEKGDKTAEKALKIVKGAYRLGQKK